MSGELPPPAAPGDFIPPPPAPSSVPSREEIQQKRAQDEDARSTAGSEKSTGSSRSGIPKLSGIKKPSVVPRAPAAEDAAGVSRIGRLCSGQAKPGLPPTPKTDSSSSSYDYVKRVTEDLGRYKLTDVQETEEYEEDFFGNRLHTLPIVPPRRGSRNNSPSFYDVFSNEDLDFFGNPLVKYPAKYSRFRSSREDKDSLWSAPKRSYTPTYKRDDWFKETDSLGSSLFSTSPRRRSSIGSTGTSASMDALWELHPRRLSEAGLSRHSDSSAVLTEDTDSFIIGQRVWVGGTKPGQIAYIGETQFAPGEWAGIVLDHPIGKNDGSVAGIRYFQCEAKRGVFSRLTRLTRFPMGELGGGDMGSVSPSPTNGNRRSPTSPTASTRSALSVSNTSLASTHVDYKIGDRVIIKSSQGSKIGTLRYMGFTSFANGEWCGVELDEPRGKNDGCVEGKRYFECRPNYGLFAPVTKVSKSPSNRRPTGANCVIHPGGMRHGNSRESLASMTSSASATPSTRRRIPPSSSKPSLPSRAALQDVLNEKQQHIEQLLRERDMERAEITRAASQADDAEQKYVLLKKEYEQFRYECELRIKEYSSTVDKLRSEIHEAFVQLDDEKRKNEDLQFKFEEAAITKGDIEVTNEENEEKIKSLEAQLEQTKCLANGDGTKLSELTEELLKSKEENESLKISLEHANVKRMVFESEEAKSIDLVQSLQAQLEESAVQLKHHQETTSKQIDELKTQIAKQSSELEVATFKYTTEIEEARTKYSIDIKGKCDELAVIKNDLTERQAESERISKEYEKCKFDAAAVEVGLKKDLDKARMDLSAKVVELESLLEVRKLNDDKLAVSQKCFDEVSAELKISKKRFDEVNEEVENTKRSLCEAKDTNEALIGELKSVKTINDNLQLELQNNKQCLSERQNEVMNNLSKVQEDLANSKKCLEQCQNELSNTKKHLEEKMGELENGKKYIEELESNIKTLNEVKSTNDALKINLEEVKASNETIKTNLDKVQTKMKELHENNTQLTEKNTELSQNIANLNATINEAHNKIANSESKNVELTSQQEELILKLAESAKNNDNLKTDVDKLKLSIGDYERKLTEVTETKNELLKHKTKLETDLQQLYGSSGESSQKLESLHKELLDKETELSKFKEENSQKLQETQRMLQEKDLELQNITQKHVQLAEALNTAEKHESDLKIKNNELVNNTNTLNASVVELNAITTQLTQQNVILNDALALKTAEIEDLQALKVKLQSTEKELQAKTTEVESLNKQIAEITSHLSSTKEIALMQKMEIIASLEAELQGANESCKETKAQITTLQAENAELNDKIGVFKGGIEVLNVEKNALTTTVSEINAELDASKNVIVELNEKSQLQKVTLEDELNKLREDVKNLEALKEIINNLEAEKAQLSAFEDKCNILEAEKKLNAEKLCELQGIIEKLENTNKSIQENIHALETDKKTTVEMLAELQGTIKNLQADQTVKLSTETELWAKIKSLEMEKNISATKLGDLEAFKTATQKELQDKINMLEAERQNVDELQAKLDALSNVKAESANYKTVLSQLQLTSKQKERLLKQLGNKNLQVIAANVSTNNDEEERHRNEVNELQEMLRSLQTKPDVATDSETLKNNNATDDKSYKQLLEEKLFAESQVAFLNSIIVDMQKKNEEQKFRIDILEKGYSPADADEFRSFGLPGMKTLPSRLYCDICEEFDLHETEDCPQQGADDLPSPPRDKDREKAPPRPYCESCEMFGHKTEDCVEDQTF